MSKSHYFHKTFYSHKKQLQNIYSTRFENIGQRFTRYGFHQ